MKMIKAVAATAVWFAGILGAGVPAADRTGTETQDGGKYQGSGIIPAERLADWRPGVTVGVPGGIRTDRTHLLDVTKPPYNADNTGAADAQPAIMKAIADAKDEDVVHLPAGKYRIDKSISIAGGKSHFTLRGAGPDQAVIMAYNQSHIEITPADGGDWWYPDRLKLDITGSPKKGETVLTVGDTKPLDAYPNGGIGQICQVALKNDLKLPVTGTGKWEYLRRHLSRIVAKTPTTVTISPGLLFDLPEDLVPVLRPGGRYSEGVGFPNMGNGWSNGKRAQPSQGQYWADWEKLLASPQGEGPGPNGFQELDMDVKATVLLKGNYNYKDNGVPGSESLQGAVLPKSLYLKEKPRWFGDLPWPPFGPDTDFEKNKIPAQVRFEAMR
jgi:hypothetical protein